MLMMNAQTDAWQHTSQNRRTGEDMPRRSLDIIDSRRPRTRELRRKTELRRLVRNGTATLLDMFRPLVE